MSYRLNNLSDLFTWIAEKELPRRYRAGAELFMCWIVEDAQERGLIGPSLAAEAQATLGARLHPHTTYGTWLAVRHPSDYHNRQGAAFHGRVAWARALAEEFRE